MNFSEDRLTNYLPSEFWICTQQSLLAHCSKVTVVQNLISEGEDTVQQLFQKISAATAATQVHQSQSP